VLALFATYLLAHFIVYIPLRRALRSEKRIFLYHFIPATVIAIVGLALLLRQPGGAGSALAPLILGLSIHGIYSLSFLELWSLAQGGYSLSVIRSVADADARGTEPDFSYLYQIGETKLRERIAALQRLGLVRREHGRVSLTNWGRAVADILFGLRLWIGSASDGSKLA